MFLLTEAQGWFLHEYVKKWNNGVFVDVIKFAQKMYRIYYRLSDHVFFNPEVVIGPQPGSTISTLLHDKINPKNCQVASPLVIQGFSNFLGLFQGIMANPVNLSAFI